MNTKNNVSNERTKNKTAAFAIVTVALALAMMTAASIIGYSRTATGKCAKQWWRTSSKLRPEHTGFQ